MRGEPTKGQPAELSFVIHIPTLGGLEEISVFPAGYRKILWLVEKSQLLSRNRERHPGAQSEAGNSCRNMTQTPLRAEKGFQEDFTALAQFVSLSFPPNIALATLRRCRRAETLLG